MGNRDSEILQSISADTATDWVHVGRALRLLEQIGQVSEAGRTWNDVVQDRLTELGKAVSSGHLHKIRRAYGFLMDGMAQLGLPEGRAGLAKISAVEVAERLYQMDRHKGLQALSSILDPAAPATFVEVQRQYKEYLSRHPEKRSALQAGWDKRKSQPALDPTVVETGEKDSNGIPAENEVSETLVSKEARQLSDDFVGRIWREAYARGRAETARDLAEKDRVIADLQARIAKLSHR